MLQDLTYGRLENEFYDREATEQDLVICVCKNRILVKNLLKKQYFIILLQSQFDHLKLLFLLHS